MTEEHRIDESELNLDKDSIVQWKRERFKDGAWDEPEFRKVVLESLPQIKKSSIKTEIIRLWPLEHWRELYYVSEKNERPKILEHLIALQDRDFIFKAFEAGLQKGEEELLLDILDNKHFKGNKFLKFLSDPYIHASIMNDTYEFWERFLSWFLSKQENLIYLFQLFKDNSDIVYKNDWSFDAYWKVLLVKYPGLQGDSVERITEITMLIEGIRAEYLERACNQFKAEFPGWGKMLNYMSDRWNKYSQAQVRIKKLSRENDLAQYIKLEKFFAGVVSKGILNDYAEAAKYQNIEHYRLIMGRLLKECKKFGLSMHYQPDDVIPFKDEFCHGVEEDFHEDDWVKVKKSGWVFTNHGDASMIVLRKALVDKAESGGE